jgi:2-polyprenyl-3-methyl-5-hydroxy-6-metoxy-1,4-benzoquinol methylase
MHKRIPQELFSLYSDLGAAIIWYVRLRWRICPFEKIARHVPLKGTIIDVGCGYGLLSNLLALASPERDVIGIDLSPKRIRAAQRTVKGRRNIKFLLQDANSLKAEKCDVFAMSDFLHHLPYRHQEELLGVCYQKLSKNGLLIMEEVDGKPYWKYQFNIIADGLLNLGQRIYFRNSSEYLKLLSRIGFQVKTETAHKGLPFSDILYLCRKD